MESSFSPILLPGSWELKVGQAPGRWPGLWQRLGRDAGVEEPGQGALKSGSSGSWEWGEQTELVEEQKGTGANITDICQTGIWPCLMHLVKSLKEEGAGAGRQECKQEGACIIDGPSLGPPGRADGPQCRGREQAEASSRPPGSLAGGMGSG